MSGERVFAPAYKPKEDILSCDSMLIEWVAIEAVKECSMVQDSWPCAHYKFSYYIIKLVDSMFQIS